MIDKLKLDNLLKKFVVEMKNIFKENMVQVILFGSYATGNQADDSDIDLMVLVDVDKIQIKKYRDKIVDIVCKFDYEYEVLISPLIQNYQEFETFKEASGFFKNVDRQGVKLSA